MAATEELTPSGHGGNIHAFRRRMTTGQGGFLDFSANINPMGPPEWLRALLSRAVEDLGHYPDPDCFDLVQSIATYGSYPTNRVVPANGSTELLYLLPRILPCKRVLIPAPAYIDYARAARLAGKPAAFMLMEQQDGFRLDPARLAALIRPGDLVIIGSPNNPTGAMVELSDIFRLAADFPETDFLIDEAFLDFVPEGQSVGGRKENVFTLNSLTKFYSIPGLRLGYGIFPEKLASLLREHLPPWTVNSQAQAVGARALQDREYQARTRATCKSLRSAFTKELQRFPDVKVFPGRANYLFVQLTGRCDSRELAARLSEQGILIRRCDNYDGLDNSYIRLAVRTEAENRRLINALADILGQKKASAGRRKKTGSLMFQGTSSNAGKSVLTAALCRILLQDGVRVAPFKAQNMSLNSFVTLQGEEMGRAQVVQAQAARLDPDVRMNPVLLKPNSDTGSQVIVKGRPVQNMSVNEYTLFKDRAWDVVRSCYDSLASEYEAIILEGAGSPGEVNLKHHDIVNMRMARHAESSVLLVGDIDRGGVYASFIGTMEVLAEWERQLVAGFVVNRFRGQASLLQSAHTYLRDHTGREVLGVIPYFHDLGLPEEDSVSFKGGVYDRPVPDSPHVEIVVVNLPHISNFTDLEPFLAEADVHLRVVSRVADLGQPDAVILPGSKNVMGDLQFLRDKEFFGPLTRLADSGCEIIGICGGYQMLGKTLHDPLHLESAASEASGLGLLDLVTELKEHKTLTRRSGVHLPSGQSVRGYEIHHGISSSSLEPVLAFGNDIFCGALGHNGQIWGSYLHGIFDEDGFRRWFVDGLREKKGLLRVGVVLSPFDLEAAFDRLADRVRENLDMPALYDLLRL
jgi:adenosylcobyric acid synthase